MEMHFRSGSERQYTIEENQWLHLTELDFLNHLQLLWSQ